MTDIAKILEEIAHTLELFSRAGSDEQRFLDLELEEYEAVTPMDFLDAYRQIREESEQ